MEFDFPAAHSMDTTWFAVDKDGHVGLFFTGEDGHLPETARTDAHEVLKKLWALRRQSGAGENDPEQHYDLDREEYAARLGLFYYKHCEGVPVGSDEILLDFYSRLVSPKDPLHVDQLPADLRSNCRTIRFEKSSFAGDERLQPFDDHPCNAWNPWGAIAYLCPDGVTVRPTPEHESEFDGFCDRLREQSPKFAAKLRFESPPEKPTKSKRKKPRGKK